jgi:hypothetical protein
LVILAFVNFLELLICFGIVYALAWHSLENARGAADGIYFSAITQTTIGYGDISPNGLLRVVTAIHAVSSVAFLVFIVGRILNALPPIKALTDSKERKK